LFVVGPDDDEDEIKLEAEKDFKSMEEYIDKDKRGVYVQASTLGSLEALLEFLRSSKIPVANISIGPVYRKDIVKASAQLEKNPEYAVVLCFDVPVDKDAKAMAEELNVKVFEG
jgi:translation initiation factor 5B